MGADSSDGSSAILKTYWPVLVAGLGVIAYLIIRWLGLDIPEQVLAAFLAVMVVVLIGVWKARSAKLWSKISASIAVVALALVVLWLMIVLFRPGFGIRALNTLEGDENAYELTDQLIWNADSLDRYGVAITFTLEIVPDYAGSRKHGQVVALISGAGGSLAPITLWDDFDSASRTQQVHLTLPELLDVSGLQTNTDPPSNLFRPGDPRYQEAYLKVRIAPAANSTDIWASEEIKLRNEAWEFRANRVWRNAEQQVDVYVKNLGGKGDFSMRYYLARLDERIGLETNLMTSGATYVTSGFEPAQLETLNRGEFFTHTIALPGDLDPGRYVVEVHPIKRLDYVRFEPGVSWEELNMRCPWWFGGGAKSFVYLVTYWVDDEIKAEWERLLADEGVVLGGAVGPAESVTSKLGTQGWRQVFQNGEIYVHSGQVYALYGAIFEHHLELRARGWDYGFPISSIHRVTSSVGTEGTMVAFEGAHEWPASRIYASRRGVAATGGWIGLEYTNVEAAHDGWLGFPLSDEQKYDDGRVIQRFEGGYFVYYPYPSKDPSEQWDRPPVAYRYLASGGILFDVYAQRQWQDTGIDVQSGDRITIVQVDGQWKYASDRGYIDANGDPGWIAPEFVHPSSTIGTLIGRIGDESGLEFPVGRWRVYTSSIAGRLHLIMNDNSENPDDYRDNEGSITVQILVEGAD